MIDKHGIELKVGDRVFFEAIITAELFDSDQGILSTCQNCVVRLDSGLYAVDSRSLERATGLGRDVQRRPPILNMEY